ncbi:MAG: hypothetical protein ACI88A_004022 [Paraglaciecola sp.]|jgi:hypothetical protein
MKKRFVKHLSTAIFGLALIAPSANAGVITSTLGSDPAASGFVDGQILSLSDVLGAPTAMTYDTNNNGSETLSNYDSTWTHSFGAITDTILSAQFTIGIYDHDSASAGSQLGAFSLDSSDYSATLDALFEGGGGANSQYNVYSFSLGAGSLAQLLDGVLSAGLTLAGPTESPGLLPSFPDQITQFNGARLIFSSLSITTQDQVQPPGPNPVPEPGVLALLFAGLGIVFARRKAN